MGMNLNVRTCQRCSKLFHYVRSPYCGECLDLLETEFKTIRDYIDSHRRTTIAQAAAETGVPEKSILFLVKEKRLSFGMTGEGARCERCGVPIPEGRFCGNCVGGLRREYLAMDPEGEKPARSAAEPTGERDDYSGIHIRKPQNR